MALMIFDISPPLSPSLAVWPGDVPLSREVLTEIQRGDSTTLSAFRMTCHLGAHADAPSHIRADGESIEQRSLEYYLGLSQVIRVVGVRGRRVGWDDVQQSLRSCPSGPAEIVQRRVLIATGSVEEFGRFPEDFAGLEPSLIDRLHSYGVITIGIDTPSVDLFGSEQLTSHHRCLENNMAILEGLWLGEVPPGVYELIALPLKLVGFDASPVRAVLRD
jgi:arylformamidase